MDGIRVTDAFFKHTNEVVFEGVLTDKKKVDNPKGRGYYYELNFEVTNVKAAFKDYMSVGDSVSIRSLPGLEDLVTIDPGVAYYPTERTKLLQRNIKRLIKKRNT